MQPKVSELLTIDLYGTLTTVRSDFAMIRSDFNLPLKLIPTVVAAAGLRPVHRKSRGAPVLER